MPKIKFGNEEEFKRWLRDITEKRKYALYVAGRSEELHAIPVVSTDPVLFGILQGQKLDKVRKAGETMSTELKLPLYFVDAVDFHDEPKA